MRPQPNFNFKLAERRNNNAVVPYRCVQECAYVDNTAKTCSQINTVDDYGCNRAVGCIGGATEPGGAKRSVEDLEDDRGHGAGTPSAAGNQLQETVIEAPQF